MATSGRYYPKNLQMSTRDPVISQHDSGDWASRRHEAERASSLRNTQKQARTPRDALKSASGGKLKEDSMNLFASRNHSAGQRIPAVSMADARRLRPPRTSCRLRRHADSGVIPTVGCAMWRAAISGLSARSARAGCPACGSLRSIRTTSHCADEVWLRINKTTYA